MPKNVVIHPPSSNTSLIVRWRTEITDLISNQDLSALQQEMKRLFPRDGVDYGQALATNEGLKKLIMGLPLAIQTVYSQGDIVSQAWKKALLIFHQLIKTYPMAIVPLIEASPKEKTPAYLTYDHVPKSLSLLSKYDPLNALLYFAFRGEITLGTLHIYTDVYDLAKILRSMGWGRELKLDKTSLEQQIDKVCSPLSTALQHCSPEHVNGVLSQF